MPEPVIAPAPQPGATPTPEPSPNPAALNPAATGGHMGATAAKPTDNGAPALEAPGRGWGDNWRELYAGEDPKMLARLQRYASPKAAIDALVAAQNKISSGELRAPLPPNATAEQIAAYRQQAGIPEKPEGYFEKLPDGLVIGAEDKPLFDSFAKGLHELNADPKIAQYAVKWYSDFQEQQLAKTAETDLTQKASAEDALRAEWGNDYRLNINHISSFLSSAPEGVGEILANARGPDGKALLNDPNTVRWLAQVARELNPVGALLPGSGENPMQGIEARKAELTKMMGDRSSAYWKGPTAEKLQKEFRDLVDSEMKLQRRA